VPAPRKTPPGVEQVLIARSHAKSIGAIIDTIKYYFLCLSVIRVFGVICPKYESKT
jgi:hypothetical protein